MSSLELFFVALPYVLVLGLGLVPPLLAIWFYRSFGAGVALFIVGLLLDMLLPGLRGLDFGVQLYFMDLVTLIISLVTALRLLTIPEARAYNFALLMFAGVVAINLAQGLPTYGATAGVAARADVYSLVALTYAMTFPADAQRIRTLVRALLWASSALFAIACLRWIAVGFQIDALLPPSGSFQPRGHSVWRVIVSNETLILAQIAVVGWFFGSRFDVLRRWRLLSIVLLAAVVVLQHRSTWAALLAASIVAILLVGSFGTAHRAWTLAGLLALVAAISIGVALGGGGLGRDIEGSLDDAVELKGTAADRLGSWRQLVLNWAGDGPRALALGRPYGHSDERYVSDDFGARKIAYQAHNYYVTVLTGLGLVGFAAYLTLWWQVCRRLFVAARGNLDAPEAALLLTLLAAQAAYYLTYGTDYVQALILGTGLSYVAAKRRISDTADIRARPTEGEGLFDGRVTRT